MLYNNTRARKIPRQLYFSTIYNWREVRCCLLYTSDTALQQMASETGGEVSTKEYSSLTELADGLLKGDCQAIVLNKIGRAHV